MICTIFRNAFDIKPNFISIDKALDRIKTGKSKGQIDEIRKQVDKERADNLKKNLPSVCFSAKFGDPVLQEDGKFFTRLDDNIIEHSGYLVLDFDDVEDLRNRQSEIISHDFILACWVSPRGNGLKALVKIANGQKHREHFQALREVFPDADKSGVNPSRVCFESYDPGIYISGSCVAFRNLKEIERVAEIKVVDKSEEIFDRIFKWLTNKGDAFVTGERNNFIFKLGGACARFGIHESECFHLCNSALLRGDNSFSSSECQRTIKSAYKANRQHFGSASFDREVLVDKITRKEVQVDVVAFDMEERARDVIFGEDVKDKALDIYDRGYEQVSGIGVPELDKYFKEKRGEPTLLSGYGNYGKSTYWKWRMLMRVILYREKYAIFGPEDNPAEEFYHEFVEILLGCDCTPANINRPDRLTYERAYDFVSKYIFYVYPEQIAPTPQYIKERFLELIIKEGVDGVGIDPFNQMDNDYNSSGGRDDRYLETFLSDWTRFLVLNNVYGWIINHPRSPRNKDQDGNYPCPGVFDLAGGAMWNNKMYNILIYHRPKHETDPQDPTCELKSAKIKKQKTVGIKGTALFEYVRSRRRYFFDGGDPMQVNIEKMGLNFRSEKTYIADPATGQQLELPPF